MTPDRPPRFSIGLPQLLDGRDPALLLRLAQRAEELGFAGLWTIDNAAGGPTAARPVLDAVHALTYVAGATSTIRLGTAVLVLPRRQPVLLAKELATLDQLSGGRLTVGVGRGRDDASVGELGFPTDRPFGRLVEGVSVMRAAWNAPVVEHDGSVWSFSGARVEPKPLQPGGPPIWFGASGPKSIERTAALANGWIGAGASTAEDFANQTRMLDGALRRAGREPADFPQAKRVYIAVEPRADDAAGRIGTAIDGLYGSAGLAERVAVSGTAAECAAALAGLADAGADELILTPLYDHARQLEGLAETADLVRAG